MAASCLSTLQVSLQLIYKLFEGWPNAHLAQNKCWKHVVPQNCQVKHLLHFCRRNTAPCWQAGNNTSGHEQARASPNAGTLGLQSRLPSPPLMREKLEPLLESTTFNPASVSSHLVYSYGQWELWWWGIESTTVHVKCSDGLGIPISKPHGFAEHARRPGPCTEEVTVHTPGGDRQHESERWENGWQLVAWTWRLRVVIRVNVLVSVMSFSLKPKGYLQGKMKFQRIK